MRKFSFSILAWILAANAEGQQNYKLNGPLVAPSAVAGEAASAAYSPDGSRIVYLADQDVLDRVELYSALADGSAAPVKLNGPLQEGGEIADFRIDPTGQRVVFRVRPTADYYFELHSAPIDGSAAAIRVSDLQVGDEYVLSFELTPDGLRVVYLTSSVFSGRHRLYSARLDGAEPVIPLTVFAGYVFEFELTPDGSRAVFTADATGSGNLNVFSVLVGRVSAGHARRFPAPRPVRLSAPASYVFHFRVSPDGKRVVFQDSAAQDTLYSVRVDGQGSAIPLHGAMVAGGHPTAFEIAGGGTRVVYRADAEVDELHELYSVPIDGSTPAAELHEHLEPDRDVFDFALTPDGARVVYRSDLRVDELRELFVAAVDGSSPAVPLLASPVAVSSYAIAADGAHVALTGAGPDCQTALFGAPIEGNALAVRLNGTPLGVCDEEDGGGNAFRYRISPDGRRVLYISDEGVDEQYELYSVPITGGLSANGHALALPRPRAVRLNAPLQPDGEVEHESDEFWFDVSADGQEVVYRARQDSAAWELYRVPTAGGTPPVKVNGTLALGPPPGDVIDSAVSPDGRRVVYLADQEQDQLFELYSVPVEGGVAVKLNGPLWSEGSVEGFAIAPDSARVVYVAAQTSGDELYSAPIDGSGEPVELSAPMVADGGVRSFEIAPDGSRVVYVADRETDGQLELWSIPIDGSTVPVKLSGALPPDGDVIPCSSDVHPHAHFTPDGARVFYLADRDGDGVLRLFGVASDGSAAPYELSGPMTAGGSVAFFATCFQLTPSGQRVVYQADQDTDEVYELYSAPTDGSALPVKLNGALVANGDVSQGFDGVHVSPAGDRVVYRADANVDEVHELFSVPVDGSAGPVKLSGTLVTGGDVSPLVRFSPDGSRVVYRADALANERFDVFSVPVDGSLAPIPLSALPAANRSVTEFAVGGDGALVVYRADQDTDQVFELYTAPIDGATPAVKIAGTCQSFRIGPDGRSVAFVSFEGSFALFHVPILGAFEPVRVSGPTAGLGVSTFSFTPQGERVVYLADQDVPGIQELYASFLPRKHAPAAAPERSASIGN